jgi:hypothetical protein
LLNQGAVAKWQGKGLQNPHRRFDSARRLQISLDYFHLRTGGTLRTARAGEVLRGISFAPKHHGHDGKSQQLKT